MALPWRFPKISGKYVSCGKDRRKVRTSHDENIVSGPDVVKDPRFLSTLKKYPVRIIGENMNHVLIMVGRLSLEATPILIRQWRESLIELGVLREFETSLASVMKKVPKNLCQQRRASAVTELLWNRSEIRAGY
jgi:hypothetical protein